MQGSSKKQRVSVAATILKRLLCITVRIRSAFVYDKQFLSCKTGALCDFFFFFLSLSLGDKNCFLGNQSTIGFPFLSFFLQAKEFCPVQLSLKILHFSLKMHAQGDSCILTSVFYFRLRG